jgi:DNA-binding beta-propeller fold protein YncE
MRQKLLVPVTLALLSVAAKGQLLLHNNSILESLQSFTASTIPANGDLNPYGVAFVPPGFPAGPNIAPGDVLVANFNAATFGGNPNVEGTGTSIVSVTSTGQQSLFATSTLIGLDTALGVLARGFVVVGNVPVPSGTALQGSLQVFNRNGGLVATINDATLLDSPWDLAINDLGSTAEIFVSNLLSGTVTRLNVAVGATAVTVLSKVRIGSGFGHQLIPAIVGVGPTGLAYDPGRDTLYVASTADNKIFAIGEAAERNDSAGTGVVVFADQTHLHGPLGLTFAPNGNLITANGDAVNSVAGMQNELVEFTPQGNFVAQYQLDGGPLGAAFGVASTANGTSFRFAAVDDDLNTLTVWTISLF